MEIELCRCNWQIPGVDALPYHRHAYTGRLVGSGRYFEIGPFKGEEIQMMEMDQEKIYVSVDWKKIARAVIKER